MPKYKVAFECPVMVIEADSPEKAMELYNEELASWSTCGLEPTIVDQGAHLGEPALSQHETEIE